MSNVMNQTTDQTLPSDFQDYWNTWYFRFKKVTSQLRLSPTYLIIGTQKGGTTSLYRYLSGHPDIRESYVKEVHFFDLNFDRREPWYRAHFNLRLPGMANANAISGDCTPYYMFHPHAPSRVASLYPWMKIIAVLRNPVDRAYSHYMHNKRKGRESRSFEAAIAEERLIMPEEIERLTADPRHDSMYHRHFSYLFRGIYIEQLLRWARYFPSDQILVIHSEDIFLSPQTVFSQMLRFLGLRDHCPDDFRAFNKQHYSSHMQGETRDELREFFHPFNMQLYEYLNTDFAWK